MNSLSNKNPRLVIEIPDKNLQNNDTQNNNELEVYTTKEKFFNLLTYDNAKNSFLLCGAWGLIYCFLIMLSLMGNGFKLLGMKDSSRMFDI